MPSSLLCSLSFFASLLAAAVIADASKACERCRDSGSTAFHIRPVGGDDSQDGLFSPPGNDTPGGSGSFLAAFGKWPQPGGLGSPVTITYSYENMFDGGLKMPGGQPLPASLIRSSIESALGLWASVAPLNFVEVIDDGLPYGQATQFGQIRIKHTFINGPDPPPPAQPIAKAQAYYPASGGNYAGDIQFDNSDPWQEVGTLSAPDILGATIHELGHSLGLGHTTFPDANMYWIFTRYSGPGTGVLHPDDIAGIQFIYGSGSGGVVPLSSSVPEPATAMLLLFLAALSWLTRRRFA